MTTDRTPVLFVHGLWLHADSCRPWIEPFREAGCQPAAPGWPGDSSSVDAKPIGHSFGGLIVQRDVAGAVLGWLGERSP